MTAWNGDRRRYHFCMAGHGALYLISGSAAEVPRTQCDAADRARNRAPGVFRALNSVELVFAIVVAAIVMASPPSAGVIAAFFIAFAMLATQLIGVRPFLNRRSDKVLAGLTAPRSRAVTTHMSV